MSEQPQPQPTRSQVTSFLSNQSLGLIFIAIVAAIFLAYNLAELEKSRGDTNRRNTVSPKPNESQSTS